MALRLTQTAADGFSRFWARWPRKVAKLEAEKAWAKLVRPLDEPAIHAALDWQIPIFQARSPEHIPHASTWIRGKRWEDEPPAPKPASQVIDSLPAWQRRAIELGGRRLS